MRRLKRFLSIRPPQLPVLPARSPTADGLYSVFFAFWGLGGLVFLLLGLLPCLDFIASADWPSIPATVRKVELRETGMSKGKRTYALSCQYSYSWNGREYVSDRIGFDSDDDREYLSLFDALRDAHLAGTPVMVRMNPERPSKAVLVRELRLNAVAKLAIGFMNVAMPAAVCAAHFSRWRAHRRRRRLSTLDPERPWTHEGLWMEPESLSKSIGSLVLSWLFALVLNALSLLACAVVWTSVYRGSWLLVAVGVFATASLTLVAYAIYLTAFHLKYGRSRMQFPQLPLTPDGTHDCLLVLNRPLSGTSPLVMTLRCIETQTVQGSRGPDTKQRTVLESVVEVDRDNLGGVDHRIPVAIEIPDGFPDRTLTGNPTYTWELEVTAAEPGVDFFATFELPVFRAASPALVQRRSALSMA